MKIPIFTLILSMIFLSLPAVMNAQQTIDQTKAKYVVLISIDGLRPDFYLDQSWPAPNLQSLKKKGVHAKGVRGIFPTVTYPSHTTMITGAYPSKHGVYYNTIFSDSGSTNIWYREEQLIKAATLWDAVKEKGLTSACISWPVSVGAPVSYNVPEAWVNNNNSINPYVTPVGLFEEIQREATGKLTYDEMNLNNLAIDENLSRIASYLIRRYKPNFTTLHIVCVDHAEHSEGREGEEVKIALASADHAVGNILEAISAAGIKDSTAIIITGDHGFVDVNTNFSPNVLLAQQGLMSRTAKGEWKAMFHSAGGSAFLHLKNKHDQQTLTAVKRLLDSLPMSVKKLFRIVERAELDKIGADPNAALALAPVEGVAISGSSSGDILRAGRGGTHGYFPDFSNIETGFIAFGAGINNGIVVPKMGLEDIAPVIAKLLALPFKAPDGILLPGIIK